MLQRRQDIISEGDCDGRCDNVGVHKGLVFTVIVTLSSCSFLTSTIFVFFTYELMVKLSVVLLWSGHLQAGKGCGLESGGGSGSVLMATVWADLPVPVCCSCIEAGFFLCRVRIPVGGTCVRRR